MAPFPCTRESFVVFLEAARPLGDGFLEDLATVQRTAYRWKDLEACEGKKQTLQSFLDCIEIARTCLLLPDSKWKQYFDGRPLPKSPPVGFVPCQTSCSSSTDGYESFEDRVRRRYDHPIDLYHQMVALVAILGQNVFQDSGIAALCCRVQAVVQDGIVLLDGVYNIKGGPGAVMEKSPQAK